MARRPDRAARARSLSRKFAMQALYQWQLTGQSCAELQNQYAAEEGFGDADRAYFEVLLTGTTAAIQKGWSPAARSHRLSSSASAAALLSVAWARDASSFAHAPCAITTRSGGSTKPPGLGCR